MEKYIVRKHYAIEYDNSIHYEPEIYTGHHVMCLLSDIAELAREILIHYTYGYQDKPTLAEYIKREERLIAKLEALAKGG